MKNYSLTLAELEKRQTRQLEDLKAKHARQLETYAKIQDLAQKPLLSEEKLLDLATRIRPITEYNNPCHVDHWLIPNRPTFDNSFVWFRNCHINFKKLKTTEVITFNCYSLRRWGKFHFDIAEVFRQIPDEVDLSVINQGGFVLNVDGHGSPYDKNLGLYTTPITLYKFERELPKSLLEIYPLPQPLSLSLSFPIDRKDKPLI